MASAGITFSGLGSGLDTAAIVKQLVALESIPIQQLEAKKQGEKDKLDTIKQFKTLLEKLQDQAETLGEADNFFTFETTISDSSIAGISASGDAVAGSHTLRVTQVATTDRWAFDGVSDADTDLATATGQTLTYTANGTDYTVTITDTAASSLTEIAALINGESPDDVTASVVNTGTDASPAYQLVLTSEASGEDFVITNLTTDIAGLNATTTNITVAQNAIAIIDGLTITRADNDFSDVLDGVSIDVLSADTTADTIFTVAADTDAIKGRITDFTKVYNEVISFINTQNTFDEEEGAKGRLFGDTLLRTVRSTISNALFDVDTDEVAADTEGFVTLGLIGIDVESDGKLTIDSTTLDEKIAENLAAFSDLFIDSDGFDNGGATENTSDYFTDTTADSGLMATLDRALDRLFKSQDGPVNANGDRDIIRSVFDTKKITINSNIKRIDTLIDARELRLESYRENLMKRFANLESIMANLQSQGSFLSATL